MGDKGSVTRYLGDMSQSIHRRYWHTYPAHPAGIQVGDVVTFVASRNRSFRKKVIGIRKGQPLVNLWGISGWMIPLDSILFVERDCHTIWNEPMRKAIQELQHAHNLADY